MSEFYGPSARKGLEKLRAERAKVVEPAAPQEAKSYQIVVQIGEDGFIPAMQFQGGNLAALYTQATWSYVCMNRIAEDVAALPGVVQERDPDTGEWVKATDHELYRVLARPFGRGAGLPPWNWQQTIEAASLHHDITGNARWRIVRTKRRLTGLHLLQPASVTVNADDNGVAREYVVGNVAIPADRVVNAMNGAPTSYYDGVSPLVAAEKAIAIDYAGHRRQKADLEQRIAPGAIVRVTNLFGMSDEQRTDLQAMLSDNFGLASQQGKPLAVGDNCEVLPAIRTEVGDIPALRAQARDEILAIFRMPPMIAGVLEKATLQHSSNALRLYWMQALQPKAANLYGAINTQAIEPIYGPNVRLWFDLTDNELGLAVLKERAGVAQEIRKLGYPTNAAAAKVGLGMERYPELDTPNTQLIEAGREEVPGESPAAEPDATDETPQKARVFTVA